MDEFTEIANALMSLAPYVPVEYMRLAAITVGVASMVLAALKPLIARYVPQQWRYWIDGAVHVIDKVAALNTKPMAERPYKTQQKK